MPLSAIRAYQDRLPRHMAQLKLVLIEAAVAPHASGADYHRLTRRLQALAWPGLEPGPPDPALLALAGIQVQKIHVGEPGRSNPDPGG